MCIICAPGAWGRAAGKPAARRFVATVVGIAVPPAVADVILRGTIPTMDDAAPRAEAMAVGQGRILAVGTMEAVMSWRGRRTRIVTFDGHALLPVTPGGLVVGGRADFTVVSHDPADAPPAIVATWLDGREISRV